MARFDAAQIQRYYDANTSAFVAYGQGGGVGAIHRAVWGPGVEDRTQAFHFVDESVAALIERLADAPRAPHVVDLGCGVCASLCHLARRLPIVGTGITLSAAQQEMAARRIADAGLSDRVVCRQGDYCDLPADLPSADLALAIESFVHAHDPARFFRSAASLVRAGGALVVCDDVKRPVAGAAQAAAIDRFCRGWHINTLLTSEALVAMADAAGFAHESTVDLSPYLELGRPRDRLIAALVAPLGRLPWRSTRLDPMIGGAALQTCLRNGWVAYELTVFRRRLEA